MPRRPDHVDPPDPQLSDGTVTLRPMRESDLAGLMEEGGDETTRRWVNVPIPYTEKHAREELTQLMGSWDDPASPLAVAPDAVRIDTTGRNVEAVVDEVVGLAAAARAWPGPSSRPSGPSGRGHFRRWAPGGWRVEPTRRTSPRNVRSSGQGSPARGWSGNRGRCRASGRT